MNLLSAWNAFSSGHMDSFVGRGESKQIASCWHPKPTQREIISLQITMSYKNRETLSAAASDWDIKISVNPKEHGESQFSLIDTVWNVNAGFNVFKKNQTHG